MCKIIGCSSVLICNSSFKLIIQQKGTRETNFVCGRPIRDIGMPMKYSAPERLIHRPNYFIAAINNVYEQRNAFPVKSII